ncbi:MAG: hypothetical protein M3Q07_06450 [Pseudobdellovibrionaceae bacterium]|nr:hypothetical protein [Pseudobdellovibrionaceae bacterium]
MKHFLAFGLSFIALYGCGSLPVIPGAGAPQSASQPPMQQQPAPSAPTANTNAPSQLPPLETPMQQAPATQAPQTPPVTGQAPASPTLLDQGKALYAQKCQSCHQPVPGAKRGSSATVIMNAVNAGPHRQVLWPTATEAQAIAEAIK